MFRRLLIRQLGHPTGPFGRWLLRSVYNESNRLNLQRTLDALAVEPHHDVLDIGFGGGLLLEWIAERLQTGHVHGIDRSADAIAVARRRFSNQIASGRLDVRLGDVQAIPFDDGAFDRACTVNTVYFWPDLPTAFSEVRRVIRPGGRFVVCFSSPESMRASWWTRRDMLTPSADEIAQALLAAGFEVIETLVDDEDAEFDSVVVVGVVRPIVVDGNR